MKGIEIERATLHNKMSQQLSRIESSPNITLSWEKGKWVAKYVPQTELATDYCFYFMPDPDKPYTVTFGSLLKLTKSIDRFLARIGHAGNISPDKEPTVFGCRTCNILECVDHHHCNYYKRKTHNQSNCDEQ